ncbi:MAG: tRNA (adenosine(37)-N6)-threonylcarbamoyltransferase complex ATPase subunit type 1 TsaE [Proteobacteria bacterium]|nr:tRNA (adenosine(37)-N6)-threonylcarbamoyltransferase complex ATPase subunit type 1 TsaE [Pseudomonadota bacterium]
MRWDSPNPEATRALATALARALPAAGGTVALSGPLGAGKTVFVKGLGEGLGIPADQVASPTFVIANLHPGAGGRALAHVDVYRLESADELEATGFADLLAPGHVVAVEWAERFPAALPADRIEVRIERGEREAERVVVAEATGPEAAATLLRWGRLAEGAAGGAEERDPGPEPGRAEATCP